jgi:DNA-binding transcriptional ArsR family regulator
MYESGKFCTSEMAEKLEVSIPTVYNHLRRMGLKTTTLPRRHRAAVKFEFSNSEKRQIIELAREGHKVVQIAVKIKRTLGPTRRIFRELGLTTTVFKALRAGERFGALTVIKAARSVKTYKGHFESRSHVACDCGKAKIVFNYVLRIGNTTSCGCRIHLKNPDRDWVRRRCDLENGARVRGLEMDLTMGQLKYLSALPCAYCSSPAMNKMKGRRGGRSTGETVLSYTGIDRVDSCKGYVCGNVIPCCHFCNRAKSNLSVETFSEWLAKLGSARTAQEIRELCSSIGSQLRCIGD